MRKEQQISRDFFKHSETGEIIVVERRCDGVILGSCTAKQPLQDLDSYICKPGNNVWIQEQSNKLILLE